MKKTFKYILMAAAAIAVYACTVETGIEVPTGTLVFTATLEQPTKATISGNQVVWQPGDQIAVFNGTEWANSNYLTEGDITEGGACATFSVTLGAAESYVAVYPVDALVIFW